MERYFHLFSPGLKEMELSAAVDIISLRCIYGTSIADG